MSASPPSVLVVDDDVSFGEMVAESLTEKGCQVTRFTDPRAALGAIAEKTFDAAVVDLVMPEMGGLDLAERIHERSPDTQVVILTGHAGMETAIEGIQRGIFDYIAKGALDLSRLESSVRAAVNRSQLLRENRSLLARLQESNRLLAALVEISTGLAAEPHLDRVLNRLVAAARELTRAASGRALLFGKGPGGEWVVEAGVGDGVATIQGTRLHPEEGIVMEALVSSQAVLVSQPREHPRYSRRSDEMPTDRPGLICAPLRHGTVQGVLMVAGSEGAGFDADYRGILGALARQGAVAIENALQHDRALNFFTHTCEILISVLESLDVYYPGHSRSVAALADMITRRLGMAEAERRNVHFAALLHDIGKIRLDPALLKGNTGFASDEARRHMQSHPSLGLELLRPITEWEEILPIIHSHHERWDGRGYPRGLAGEEIPLGARVVAVADAFDAMTRDTPHGPHRSPDEAIGELEAFAGSQFDARIVRLFVAEYRQRGDQIKA